MQQALHKGKNHADLAQALSNVGVAYGSLDSYTEARKHLEQALKMQQALHKGKNHDDVAKALHDMGVAYLNLGADQQNLKYLKDYEPHCAR